MPTGRPKKPLILTKEEREKLEQGARRPPTAQRLAVRSRIVLRCAEGLCNQAGARALTIRGAPVGKWRERFRPARLEGLAEAPRPGAPREISDAQVEEVITRTLESTPPAATPWSPRAMARATQLSRATVSRMGRALGLQPHRTETFKLSSDPFFVEKVRDIGGLYLHPPDHALVRCGDEKSPVQALDRTRPVLPLRPGVPARQRHDYLRQGPPSLFAALEVATGQVIGKGQRRHRAQEFLKFLEAVEGQLPVAQRVPLVMDNYATHKTPKVQRGFARPPRYPLHFTPTRASWLNQVERFFAQSTQRRLRRGTLTHVRELEQAIHDYLAHHNRNPKPFLWTATANTILNKVKRFCERTSETRH